MQNNLVRFQSEKHIPGWKETISQRGTRFLREVSPGPLQRCDLGKGDKKCRRTRNQQFRPSQCPGCYWNDVLLSLKGALLVISAITLSYTWWRTHSALLSFQQTKPNCWKISIASMRSARAQLWFSAILMFKYINEQECNSHRKNDMN